MARVTYFPRYSQRENAVTNTTLHLFSQINLHSTERFQTLLGALLGDVEIPLGISFEQQIRSHTSVPDAVISQEPVRIVIETKVDAGVNADQLIRHCDHFSPSMRGNFLLLLTKVEIPAEQLQSVKQAAEANNARFCATTFEKLRSAVSTLAYEHETHLKHVIEDFVRYCDDAALLPDRRRWLSIVPCGDTFDLNARWHMYYKPADRGYEPGDYLGIYRWKAVRLIGKIIGVYDLKVCPDGDSEFTLVRGTDLPIFRERMPAMIEASSVQLGWRIGDGMRFFCCEQLVPTEFKKTSPHGIQGGRYWDITSVLTESMSDEQLAVALENQIWS